jgi:hypothetical protein
MCCGRELEGEYGEWGEYGEYGEYGLALDPRRGTPDDAPARVP